MIENTHNDSMIGIDSKLTNGMQVACRGLILLFLLPGAALKFIDYGNQATFFAEIGIPAAEVMVVVVGVIELLAAAAMILGIESRLAGLSSSVVMIAAIVLAGPEITNMAVLLASIGISLLGTGPYSIQDAESDVVARIYKNSIA